MQINIIIIKLEIIKRRLLPQAFMIDNLLLVSTTKSTKRKLTELNIHNCVLPHKIHNIFSIEVCHGSAVSVFNVIAEVKRLLRTVA
jgi:hypothetical protein